MDAKKNTIWIDLDNSPHVPLFVPIVRHYRETGVDVVLTARDHSQTLELLKLSGLDDDLAVVGTHYGKNKLNKIRGLLVRALQLVAHIKRNRSRIAVAVSHGSRSMVLAAKWLRIPVITMYDYEFTETAIFNRFSDRVIVPEKIPDDILDKIGLAADKRVKYPGIKEELYVREFVPDQNFWPDFCRKNSLAISDRTIIVALRPPATTANYHSAESDKLLVGILRRLMSAKDTFTVVVPRTDEQGLQIKKLAAALDSSSANYLILETAVNGLDLAFAADLLISGGGTMNREAALLGVPVYSVFAGKQGALDAQMESDGAITFVRDQDDIERIVLEKRLRENVCTYSNALTHRVERFVIEQIDSFLDGTRTSVSAGRKI